jgi:SAM-dependent methyltransferase
MPVEAFACPVHKSPLIGGYRCSACDRVYPVIAGVPVLLNEANSVFRIAEFQNPDSAYGGASAYAGALDKRSGLRQLYRRMVFSLSESGPPKRAFSAADAIAHVLQLRPNARILVIGAGDTSFPGDVTYTDVAFGRNVACIADAHDLPFVDASFDACVANAVLEHVVDPYRCVEEIARVLGPSGFVYAETPFMQPVHMRAHDFTRFTYLGHRRLFRRFADIRSGVCGGPGVSAAQLLRYALTSVSDRPQHKKWLKLVALLVTWPLRWVDLLTDSTASAYDSASAFYFFGQLCDRPISDRELLAMFRGC